MSLSSEEGHCTGSVFFYFFYCRKASISWDGENHIATFIAITFSSLEIEGMQKNIALSRLTISVSSNLFVHHKFRASTSSFNNIRTFTIAYNSVGPEFWGKMCYVYLQTSRSHNWVFLFNADAANFTRRQWISHWCHGFFTEKNCCVWKIRFLCPPHCFLWLSICFPLFF